MKKIASSIAATYLVVLCSTAIAHPGHSSAHQHPHIYYGHDQHHHGRGGHGHWRKHHNGALIWVPAVISGIMLYELGKQNGNVVIIERSRKDAENEVVQCSEWREVQDNTGRIYRERTCRTSE